MTVLRIAVIVVWGFVILYMSPAVWSLSRGKARRSDPSRFAWFCVAWVQVLGTLRWFYAPDSEELWQAVYVLLIGVGLYVPFVSRSYGRGPRVDAGEEG